MNGLDVNMLMVTTKNEPYLVIQNTKPKPANLTIKLAIVHTVRDVTSFTMKTPLNWHK